MSYIKIGKPTQTIKGLGSPLVKNNGFAGVGEYRVFRVLMTGTVGNYSKKDGSIVNDGAAGNKIIRVVTGGVEYEFKGTLSYSITTTIDADLEFIFDGGADVVKKTIPPGDGNKELSATLNAYRLIPDSYNPQTLWTTQFVDSTTHFTLDAFLKFRAQDIVSLPKQFGDITTGELIEL